MSKLVEAVLGATVAFIVAIIGIVVVVAVSDGVNITGSAGTLVDQFPLILASIGILGGVLFLAVMARRQ